MKLDRNIDFSTIGLKRYEPDVPHTQNVAWGIMTSRVPQKLMMRSVYYPILLDQLAYELSDNVCDIMARNKISDCKKLVRKIRKVNEEYIKVINNDTGPRELITSFIDFFHQWYQKYALKVMVSWVYAYQELTLKCTPYSKNVANTIAVLYTAKESALLCKEIDYGMIAEINQYLDGSGLKWGHSDYTYADEIATLLVEMIRKFGMDETMHDVNTDYRKKDLRDAIETIELVSSELPNMSDMIELKR